MAPFAITYELIVKAMVIFSITASNNVQFGLNLVRTFVLACHRSVKVGDLLCQYVVCLFEDEKCLCFVRWFTRPLDKYCPPACKNIEVWRQPHNFMSVGEHVTWRWQRLGLAARADVYSLLVSCPSVSTWASCYMFCTCICRHPNLSPTVAAICIMFLVR